MRPYHRAFVVALASSSMAIAAAPADAAVRSLDGSQNNIQHPRWGQANTPYPRVTAANYADGRATPVSGPPVRYVSNRVFNDTSQNLFSENGVTQWGAAWGQFLDHTFGLRMEEGGEDQPIAFDRADPLEAFRNDFGSIAFMRTPPFSGTGVTSPRQQENVVGGYIDASTVYGDTAARLRWLRKALRERARASCSPAATSRGPMSAETPQPPRRWH